jgi:hypothetical protein
MIYELKTKTNQTLIHNRFTPELQLMIDENPALLFLIDKIDLIEV